MRRTLAPLLLLTHILWGNVSGNPAESACSQPPVFVPADDNRQSTLGSTVTLNCTALLPWDPQEPQCDSTLHWIRDGSLLSNLTKQQNLSEFLHNTSQKVVNSLLELTLREPSDFGLYICTVRNISAQFQLQEMRAASHMAVVIAVMVLLVILALAILIFSKCHLDIKLWYRNTYGDFEMNDGKLYDAYVSYANNENDRKFVNFILKPQLENKQGYKLHLDHGNILPGSEPSAELLMNVSRCRRLIVVLSLAYLEQDWCTSNLREGLWRLLELSQKPILITWETQKQHMGPDTLRLLHDSRQRFTILTWSSYSMTPSSVFWKELSLALPRKMAYHCPPMTTPQTLLQDDRDPMLSLHPDYLDCHPDPDCDPSGDLGLQLPVYKTQKSRAPSLPAAPPQLPPVAEAKPFDIDVSDLGSRNYGARADFYCLVTKEDV
uniref:Single immunoglobulin and toll-interleukin 1 receptor (TIR) domain n=1 Tax=Paramormyrops kingsleyae TaxID=1676925 RepID=A0A3B3SJJ4_9TELE|nr:single Ig IL-1-related receptor isoform X1 [Paramormyrops kingsleyae]